MKKVLAGLVIAALFAGTASADWQVYRFTKSRSQYNSTVGYTNSSAYGTATHVRSWNNAPVTNPAYLTGARGADGKPVVTFDKKKDNDTDTALLVVKIGADGKSIVSTNSESVVSVPEYEFWANGSIYATNAASTSLVEATHGWIDYSTVKAAQFQPGVTNKPSLKTIKRYAMTMWKDDSHQLIEAKGYQTVAASHGIVLAGKKPKSSFAKTARSQESGASIYSAEDDRTTSSIPYLVRFSYTQGYKYDSGLSKKLNAVNPVNVAAALTTLKGLLGTKYHPLSYRARVHSGFYVDEDWKDASGNVIYVDPNYNQMDIVVIDGVPYIANQEPWYGKGVWWW